MLYDEPHKLKLQEKLAECFDVYFNTFKPSLQKTITIQSQLSWLANICQYVSPYFRPLIGLFDTLHEKIILPMTFAKGSFKSGKETITHDDMVKCFLNALSKFPDESWIAKASPDNRDSEPQSCLVGSGITMPQSGLELSPEDSSEDDASSISSESDSIDVLCMCQPSPVHQTSRPSFTSSSVSSGGTRRQCPEADMDYVDLCMKQPHFTLPNVTEQLG